jgi:hypothetical protein
MGAGCGEVQIKCASHIEKKLGLFGWINKKETFKLKKWGIFTWCRFKDPIDNGPECEKTQGLVHTLTR